MYRSDLPRRVVIVLCVLLMPLARAGDTDDTDPTDSDTDLVDTDAGDTDTGVSDTAGESGRDTFFHRDTGPQPPHTECIPWDREISGRCPVGFPGGREGHGETLHRGTSLVDPSARGVFVDGQCCYQVRNVPLGCAGGGFNFCGCGC
jgi:hypothetical protein